MSNKSSILVFEDSASVKVLEKIFEGKYNAEYITEPIDALQKVLDIEPDVVLLNIDTPEGLKNLAKLADGTKDTIIIATTNSDDIPLEALALQMGAKDCIKKPFAPAIVAMRTANCAEHAHERKLAYMDELTQISNRRSHNITLNQTWENIIDYNETHTNKESVSIIMMDIDNFKKYNDHYGHAQGDIALSSVAKAAKKAIRKGIDHIARYGGEEFAIILPNTSSDEAVRIAERVRESVYSLDMEHKQNASMGRITVSIGVSTCEPDKTINLKDFLKHCDDKLYEAKEQGRNRVCKGKHWNGTLRLMKGIHRPRENKGNNNKLGFTGLKPGLS